MKRFKFTDWRLELDDGSRVRFTDGGYMTAMPRVARTGIQLYRGSEVGKPDMKVVRVYRPEEEVFKKDSLSTFVGKPFTDDHPPEDVTAANWKKYGRGVVGEDILRDGDAIRVPMVLMDGETIKKVKGGKRQLSVGYDCEIVWENGTTPTGETYDAKMVDIHVNHVAVVDEARAGPEFAIGDNDTNETRDLAVAAIQKGAINNYDPLTADSSTRCLLGDRYPVVRDGVVYSRALRDARIMARDAKADDDMRVIDELLALIDQHQKKDTATMKTIIVDGITCEMSDTAAEVVRRALDNAASATKEATDKLATVETTAKTQLDAANASIAKLTTEVATKDAEIVTLKKQLDDAKLTPERLDQLVKDRETVAIKAKALLPTVVVDGKSIDDVKRQVVASKVGDAIAAAWSAEQVSVSFDTLTAGVDVTRAGGGAVLDTARVLSAAPVGGFAAVDAAQQKYDKALTDAWKH